MTPDDHRTAPPSAPRRNLRILLLGWSGQLAILIVLVLAARTGAVRSLGAAGLLGLWAAVLVGYWAVTTLFERSLLRSEARDMGPASQTDGAALARAGAVAFVDLAMLLGLASVSVLPRAWVAAWLWPLGLVVLIPVATWLAARLSGAAREIARASRAAGDNEFPEIQALMHGEKADGVELRVLPQDASQLPPIAYLPFHEPPLICLSETVLARLAPAERAAVFAHELAHHRLKHGPQGLRRSAALWLLAALLAQLIVAGAEGPVGFARAAYAMAPAVLLVRAFLLAARPVVLALTRREELAANGLAMDLAGGPESLLSALEKLPGAVEFAGPGGGIERLLVDAHPTLTEIAEKANLPAR